jgi:predicted metal-dependent hydrolase
MTVLKYLAGYPESLQAQVRALIQGDRLGRMLATRYTETHAVRNDRQLYDYVQDIKSRHLRKSVPLGKVLYDGKLQVVKHALGTHTAISRAHGGQLKASREIRIASVFRDAPAPFLQMIVVHELAHLRQLEHDKAFYQLCTTMAPDYHQLELDTRLWLTHREMGGQKEALGAES